MQKFVAGEFSMEHKVATLLQELLAMDDCSEGCLEVSGPQVTGLIGLSSKGEIVAAQVTPAGPAGIEALERLLILEDGSYIFHEGRFVEGEELFSVDSHALTALANKVKGGKASDPSLKAETNAGQLTSKPEQANSPREKDIASTSGFYEKLKMAITLESRTNLLAMSQEEGQVIAGADPQYLPLNLHAHEPCIDQSCDLVSPTIDLANQAESILGHESLEFRSEMIKAERTAHKARSQAYLQNRHITSHLIKSMKESITASPLAAASLRSTGDNDPDTPRRTKTIVLESVKRQEKKEKKLLYRQMELTISVVLGLVTLGFAFSFWSALDEIVQEQRAKALYNKGKLNNAQYQELLALTDKSLAWHSNSAKLHYYRGLCLRHLKRTKEALQEFKTGLKLAPRDAQLLDESGYTDILLGQYQNAVNLYSVLLKNKHYQAPNAYAKRGFAYMSLGDFARARNDLLQVRPTKFDRKNVALNLAVSDAELGKFSEAEELLKTLLAVDDNDPEVYTKLGFVLIKAKKYREAESALLKSIAMRSTAEAYIQLADLAKAKQDTAAMINYYSQYLSLCPQDSNVLLARARAYVDAGELDAAERDYDTIEHLGRIGDRHHFYSERGDVLRAQGKVDLAAKDYEKARAASPHVSATRIKLADCLAKGGHYMQAEDVYSSLLLEQPKNVEFHLLRGEAAMNAKDYSTAEEDFEKAVELTKGDLKKQETAYGARGLNYFTQGLYKEANIAFDHVLKLNASNVQAKTMKAQIAAKTVLSSAVPERQSGEEPGKPKENASQSVLIKSGYALMERSDNDSAIKLFAQAIRQEPGNIQARRYLAYALCRAAADLEAIEQFEILDKTGSLSDDDLEEYVKALKKTGKEDKAILILNAFTHTHPADTKAGTALENLLAYLYNLGKYDQVCIRGMKVAKTTADYNLFHSLLTDQGKLGRHHREAAQKSPGG